MRVAVCSGQIPFIHGGAEVLTQALAEQLRLRGHEAEVIQIPFRWYPKSEILKGYLAWRLINLDESEGRPIDRVIALKFPAFLVQHPYKVTWLIQQFRQAYELFGTEHSHFSRSPEDDELRRAIWRMDTTTLAESRKLFSISANVSSRLLRYNRLRSAPLHPPPALDGKFVNDGYEDYVFTVSRLNVMKRVDHLIRAMGKTRTPVRCKIAGQGAELARLQALAVDVGADKKIDFVGFVDDAAVLRLYAHALAVYYAPLDEDYGFVTVEAMKSAKPVLTTTDSGGPLEFVADRVTGLVAPPADPDALARHIDELYEDRSLAERLGAVGLERVRGITWDVTIAKLLES